MIEQEPATNATVLLQPSRPRNQPALQPLRTPICSECAVLTPTGYRCKECVRGQQKVFDTARWIDYPLAIVIAGVLLLSGQHWPRA